MICLFPPLNNFANVHYVSLIAIYACMQLSTKYYLTCCVHAVGFFYLCIQFTDFILFVLLAAIWTDILQIRGKGLSSLFALGGAGTFALTFASQDLVKKVLNGLALSATDAFHVGDSILLGDGEYMNMYTDKDIYNTTHNLYIVFSHVTCIFCIHRNFWYCHECGLAHYRYKR